ncbi:MAG: efflux RND transporter periplasmic adaptor subunit [Pseudomonadota bacterium]
MPVDKVQHGNARLWPIGGVCAALLLAIEPTAPAFAQGRPATVGVAAVEERKVVETRAVLGQLTAAVEAQVATRTAGIVSDVLFSVGDEVSRGSVLIRMDRTRVALERKSSLAAVEVATAGRAVAQAELRRAAQAFDRQKALRGSRAFSRSRFEDLEQDAARARALLVRATAELRQAEAALAEVDYRVANMVVRAPFDGVIIGRDAQPGAYMSVGSRVATMMDVNNLEIEADIPVELVSGLTPGTSLTVAFDGGANSKAIVRAVLPVQTIATRTRPVRFTVDLSKLDLTRLARGKSVTLSVPAGPERIALTVPKDALVQSARGWMVFAVVAGKAVPKRVQFTDAVADRVIVTNGLLEGELVVVRGNERLRPGQAVSPNPGAKPAARDPKKSSRSAGSREAGKS